MAGINKSAPQLFFTENLEDEPLYDRLAKEVEEQTNEVWMDAIDSSNAKDYLTNTSSPWIVEDDSNALDDYMDDVSDIIQLDDIENIEW